jgi:sugar phosphate isomerase/epimerase
MLRAVLILACGLLLAAPRPLQAQLPAEGLFARTNLVAWCIVPFDSQKRTPEERAAMLERLGIRRLAYDWRAEHIPTFDAEVAALRKRGIELTAWWFPAALNDEAKAILACLERNRLSPQLWITLGTEPEPNPARLAEKIDQTVATLAPLCTAAQRLGSTVGLYNHLGWFGEPTNQVKIIQRLRAAGHTNVGSVYNFHHGHAHIDTWPQQLDHLKPYLLAVNLNGMVWDGDQLGKKIIPLGSGDEELRMLQVLQASGWKGPVGILGHTDEDAELKLRKELAGLERLAPLSTGTVAGNRSVSKSTPARAPGEPAVSGREPGTQGEKDWVDNRWQQTDIGPFLASTVHLPGGVVKRALTVKVSTGTAGTVTYDMETGAIRAAWTGGFLTFDPTRFGLIGAIRPEGTLAFEGLGPRKDAPAEFRWTGIHNGAQGPVLEYQLNGVRILEAPGFLRSPVGPVFVRSFWVGPRRESLNLLIAGHTRGTNAGSHVIHGRQPDADTSSGPARRPGRPDARQPWSGLFVHNDAGEVRSGAAVVGLPSFTTQSFVSNDGGREELTLPAGDTPLEITVYLWRGSISDGETFQKFIQTIPPAERSPEALAQAGPARWAPLTTRGQRGADTDFLAIDTLTVPYDNPFNALLFGSGVDVDPEGAVYFSTLHGDVWKITGVDVGLQKLRWQRFATGLYQPLGLKVKAGQVYVLGRDRITRLHDTNRDGEADFYENFFDGIATSAGGHDYVTCLEVDDAGRFYYVDPVGLHRVEADGRRSETLATGFRNPNGMGVRPDGRVITVAPQQGNWTPSSFIAEIRPGGYYGYGGPRPDPARPLGYDAPLCWIPHGVDNSSGSQVWVPSGQWGPLGGQMLHLLWGRCGLMLVLRDSEGAESPALQGAVVPLPGKFLSGPNRGSFDPRDGSLYIAGSTGWQTSAVKDGALQRVRFTGKRAALPIGFHVRPGGLEVRFSVPVDRATAEDPGSYALKRWNYRYAETYGSKDWSVAAPDREGRDDVSIRAATLAADGKTVFLEIPDLKPVMQMELKYNVDAAEGDKPLRGQLWLTVNEPGPER